MKPTLACVLFIGLAVSSTATQPPTPDTVRVVMNGHVTGQLPKEARDLAPMFLPITRDVFEGSYLMVSQWYGVPKKPTADPGPVAIPWIRFADKTTVGVTTPDRERPLIPDGAVTRKNNETVVPLWMHFETAWRAKDTRPDKGCPHPIVRMQWRTASHSGGYMPLASVSEGNTTGGTGLPDYGELRMFTVDHSNAYVIVANRHDSDGFEVRLLTMCGSQMWERLPSGQERLP